MKTTYTINLSQAGFGIIEVMIALLLGIVIMLGVTEVATNNSQTRYEVQRAGQQIENAAYALRVLEGDLANAAFWGESRGEVAGATPPPICLDDGAGVITAAVIEEALGYPLQGGHINESPLAPYDKIQCNATVEEDLIPKPGTDYLAIRRASSCAEGSVNSRGVACDAVGTNFNLRINACFDQDNPQDTERVKISNSTADDDDFTMRNCADHAPVYRFLNRIYYVNTADQLVRAELLEDEYTRGIPLVDNVEMLRFEYGLDTSGDGQEDLPADADDPYPSEPDAETNAGDPPNATDIARWANVVRVTVTLIVRSSDASAGFVDDKIYDLTKLKYDYSGGGGARPDKSVDFAAPTTYCANLPPRPACDVTIPADVQGHRRQVYTRTVSLRNVAGRR